MIRCWWKYLEECYTYGYYCWDWTYCSKNLSKNDKKKQHTCWKFKGLLQVAVLIPTLIIYFQSWNSEFSQIQVHAACGMYLIPKNLQDMSSVHRGQYIPILWVGITFPHRLSIKNLMFGNRCGMMLLRCTRYTTDLFSSMWTETISQHFSLLVPIDGSTS